METLLQDLRFGIRMLVRNPGSTGISVLALALGIGLTTMMFSIVHAAVLRGLPFDRPEQLLNISRTNLTEDIDQMGVSIHDFEDWRAQQTSFTDLAAFYSGTINVSGLERPERFDGGFITINTFDIVGVRPVLGRGFTEEDGRPGADAVMLLSWDTWQNRFAGDEDIIGTVVRSNARPTTIVGVMPEGFAFPNSEELWIPMPQHASMLPRNEGVWLSVFGRLRDDVSPDQAALEMTGIASRLEASYPETNEGIGTLVQPYVKSFLGAEPIAMLFTMLGAVFMVLLIACANVANLLISRAAERSREIGIRSALGASRIRVVRQFLTESFILSLAGALAGLAIAWVGITLFNRAIEPTDPPFWIVVRLDAQVMMFVLAVTALAAFIAGVIPAWQAAIANVNDVLKDESRGASSFRLGRISRGLVVAEIALSAGLLVGAGLMIKSVTAVRTIDFAFATEDVFTARIGLPEAQYPDQESQRAFFDRLVPRLNEMPGVEAVGLIQALPAAGGSGGTRFALDGSTYIEDRDYPSTALIQASGGAFDALGVSVLQGRGFTDQDRVGNQGVVLVNSSFVERFFDGQDPIGRRVRFGTSASDADWLTIVGVVPDMWVNGMGNDEGHDAIYTPVAQAGARFMSVIARVRSAEPLTAAQPLRAAVLAVDPDLPIYFVQTLQDAIDANNWFYMVFGTLFMVFGAVALFLASVGLYGVMSNSVSQRTREMGVRMALGAEGRDVLRLVMRQGLVQLGIGLAIGLALALGVSNLLQILLFEVEPRDPLIYAAIGAVLTLTATAACMIPATRATRVHPMQALRYD